MQKVRQLPERAHLKSITPDWGMQSAQPRNTQGSDFRGKHNFPKDKCMKPIPVFRCEERPKIEHPKAKSKDTREMISITSRWRGRSIPDLQAIPSVKQRGGGNLHRSHHAATEFINIGCLLCARSCSKCLSTFLHLIPKTVLQTEHYYLIL